MTVLPNCRLQQLLRDQQKPRCHNHTYIIQAGVSIIIHMISITLAAMRRIESVNLNVRMPAPEHKRNVNGEKIRYVLAITYLVTLSCNTIRIIL